MRTFRLRSVLLWLAIFLLFVAGCSASNGLVRIVGRNLVTFFHKPAPATPRRPASFRAGQVAVTWIGHATTLIQIEDRFVMTDPVFTDTVGAVSRRLVAPGLQPDDLPWIDVVLISHPHFDHLSIGSLELLRSHAENLLVPYGTQALLPDQRYTVWVMPWGARYRDGELLITSLPVKHVAGRYGLDASWRPRGFNGYLVQHRGRIVFFAGDTALSAEMARTVRALAGGRIDIALLPIAPQNPRALMKRTHVDADEAFELWRLLDAEHLVAIHFDTFVNSDDAYGAAAARLTELAQQHGVPDRVHVLAHGEQFVLDTSPWRSASAPRPAP